MSNIEVRPFELIDVIQIKDFTDEWIGKNYYSIGELTYIQNQSCAKSLNASLLAFDGPRLIGVRLSLAPSKWIDSKIKISQILWNRSSDNVAYFKSLFIHSDFRSLGLGSMLSLSSQQILVEMGAEAIVTHSWLESPNNSSLRYLKKAQFVEIARHPKFWYEIDYQCTRCKPDRCVCTAVEMIKYDI